MAPIWQTALRRTAQGRKSSPRPPPASTRATHSTNENRAYVNQPGEETLVGLLDALKDADALGLRVAGQERVLRECVENLRRQFPEPHLQWRGGGERTRVAVERAQGGMGLPKHRCNSCHKVGKHPSNETTFTECETIYSAQHTRSLDTTLRLGPSSP